MEQLKVNITKENKSIIKLGFIIQAGLIILVTFAFVSLGIEAFSTMPVFSVIIFLLALASLYIAKKYLDRVSLKEYIILDKKTLTLVAKTWLSKKEEKIPISEIEYLEFCGGDQFTKHPMENDVIDFTGLGTTEKEIQLVTGDCKMELVCNNKQFKFGKDIYSWDAENVIRKMELFLGITFNKRINSEENQNEEI